MVELVLVQDVQQVVVEVVEQPQLDLMLQALLLEEQVVQEHQTIF